MKCVHLLYQLQVVSDNVYIGVAPTKPRKWSTQLVLTVTPIVQNIFHEIKGPKKTTKISKTKFEKSPLQNQQSTEFPFV